MAPSRDNILQLLQTRGPLVPNDIKKVLGGDTLILGAMLAELASRKMVNISNLKRGGSPFYFLPGQEAQLERCMQYLPPKDHGVIDFLKEHQVVEDKKLELAQRVSLRQTKDFAKELKVNTPKGEMLFWRYFLIPEDEAIAILNKRFAPPPPPPPEPVKEPLPEPVPEPVSEPVVEPVQEVAAESESQQPEPTPRVEEVQEAINNEELKEDLEELPVAEPEPAKESVKEPVKEPTPQPRQEENNEPQEKEVKEEKKEGKEGKEEKKEEKKPAKKEKKKEEQGKDENQEVIITEPSLEETEFYLTILKFFDEHEITMLKEEQITKNKEYEFVVRVPSAVGKLTMLARAKNKKRLNEGDVAPALLKAKTEDLSCLFLTPGQFTKKSQEIIKKEYKGLVIKEL